MNDTQSLLAFVYKNAEMGSQTMPRIAEKASGEFRRAVINRLHKYESIQQKAGKLLAEFGADAPDKAGLNGLEKASTDVMLKMNLTFDDSVPHMADLLIRGSAMGIRDVSEQMAKFPSADPRAMELASDLKQLEDDGLSEMKKFLEAK